MLRRGTKRKAPEPAAPPARARSHDAALVRVVRALETAARRSVAPFASGASERFPLPALAFSRHEASETDDQEEEMVPPLRRDDVRKIQARARQDGAAVWTVEGASVAVRHPRWPAFLQERVAAMREPLGLTRDTVLSLHKLVLVGVSGVLPVDRRRGGGGSAGTLLVVLPGAFTGGDVAVATTSEDNRACREDSTTVWRPSCRESAYDLSYAAFSDTCSFSPTLVTSGAALCLLYDLLPATASEIPLFEESTQVQAAVVESLHRYFNASLEPLTKKFKIGADAARTIAEYGVERHFAYLVEGSTFADLQGEDHKVAQSLAAFCAKSGGQYVLYLSHALCSQYSTGSTLLALRAGPEDDDSYVEKMDSLHIKVTLKAPWIKYGERQKAAAYPPVFLRTDHDVAPLGRVGSLRLHCSERLDALDAEIITARHRYRQRVALFTTRALVVQPASIEHRQLALLPIKDMIQRLRGLHARDAALQYARCVVYHRRVWSVRPRDMERLADFVGHVVGLNDPGLFNELLLTLDMEDTDTTDALRGAVLHFGWGVCIDAIQKRIRALPMLSSRVHLILSVVQRPVRSVQINALIEPLLSLHPWTNVMVEADTCRRHVRYLPRSRDFGRVLALALAASPGINKVASVGDLEVMVRVVVPALTKLFISHPSVPQLRSALLQVWKVFQSLKTQVSSAVFASLRVPDHCIECIELQSFLSSPTVEKIVECRDAAQLDHIRAVLHRATSFTKAVVQIDAVGSSAVRLTKKRKPNALFDKELVDAERHIRDLIREEPDREREGGQ